jgi:hypothetical protein
LYPYAAQGRHLQARPARPTCDRRVTLSLDFAFRWFRPPRTRRRSVESTGTRNSPLVYGRRCGSYTFLARLPTLTTESRNSSRSFASR